MRFEKLSRLLFEDVAYVVLSKTEPDDKKTLLGQIDSSDPIIDKIKASLKQGDIKTILEFLKKEKQFDDTWLHLTEQLIKNYTTSNDIENIQSFFKDEDFFDILSQKTGQLSSIAPDLPKRFKQELFKETSGKTAKGMGRGELFLGFLTNLNKGKVGDLATKSGVRAEVKARDSYMETGGSSIPSQSNEVLKELLHKKFPKLNAKDALPMKVLEILFDNIKTFNDDDLKEIAASLRQYKVNFDNSEIIKKLKEVSSSKDLQFLIAAVHTETYMKILKCAMIFVNEIQDKFITISKDASFSEIYEIIKSNFSKSADLSISNWTSKNRPGGIKFWKTSEKDRKTLK